MTTIARPATCAAQFPPLAGAPRPLCDRLPHDDRMHVACINGVPFAWSDPDNGVLGEWDRATLAAVRDVYPEAPEGRVGAVLSAVEVLVAYWRALPGGPKGTERFNPQIKALIAAYDQLDNPVAEVTS